MFEYTEALPPRSKVGLRFGLFGAILLGGAGYAVITRLIGPDPMAYVIAGMTWFAGLLSAMYAIRSGQCYHIIVRESMLRFGYRPRMRSVPVNAIDTVQEQEFTAATIIANRLAGRARARGAIHRFGPGVRVHLFQDPVDWLIPTNDPSALALALGKSLQLRPSDGRQLLYAGIPDHFEYTEVLKRGRAAEVGLWCVGFLAYSMHSAIALVFFHRHAWMALPVILPAAWVLASIHSMAHRMKIRVGGGRLFIESHGRKSEFACDQVDWIEEDRLEFPRDGYFGSWHRRGARVFANTGGKAVLMKLRDNPFPILFRTEHPEDVARALGHELRPTMHTLAGVAK